MSIFAFALGFIAGVVVVGALLWVNAALRAGGDE